MDKGNQRGFNLGIPSDYEGTYHRLGVDPKGFDQDDGRNTLSEKTLPIFFPELFEPTKSFWERHHLELKRHNKVDKYDIDFAILKDGKAIAYIDNERRSVKNSILLFGESGREIKVNIPTRTLRSNVEQRSDRLMDNKFKYYSTYPERSFHLARHDNMTEAICCWAKDFYNLERIKDWRTDMGPIEVVQVPREFTRYGKAFEHTIEGWILSKLEKEGII